MLAWMALLSPAVIVTCIAIAMLRRQTRGVENAAVQNRRFLLYVAGGGCAVVILMIVAAAILALAQRGSKAPLWLVSAPWGFAIGEVVGLVLWKRRAARAAA